MIRWNANEPLKLSKLWQLSSAFSLVPSHVGHFSNLRHFVTCHISVIDYITGILGRGCCIMKERNIFCHSCLKPNVAVDIRGHCVADKPGFLSLWKCNSILLPVSKASGRGEQRQSSPSLARCPPRFLFTRDFLREGKRGDKMFRHRVTECQTARNSQLVLPAPSGVTVGTQS